MHEGMVGMMEKGEKEYGEKEKKNPVRLRWTQTDRLGNIIPYLKRNKESGIHTPG